MHTCAVGVLDVVVFTSTLETHIYENMDFTCFSIFEHAKSRTFALGPAITNKHWAPMAADHSARGSMKTGVKPETVCELQDTNDHRQVERKWQLPISVGELSAFEGRFSNHTYICVPWTLVVFSKTASSQVMMTRMHSHTQSC